MKDPIVKLKTEHAAMVADKKSSKTEIKKLEKQIRDAEADNGIEPAAKVKDEEEPEKSPE